LNKPLIVLSIPYGDVSEYINSEADYIEVRLDYKKNLTIYDIDEFLKYKEKVILTIRDSSEGGIFPIRDDAKLNIYKKIFDYGIKYDVEMRFLEKYKIPYEGEIVSSHYLNSLPGINELIEKYKKLDNLFTAKVAIKNINGYKSILAKFLEIINNPTVIPIGAPWYERISYSLLGSKLLYVYDKVQTGEGQPKLSIAAKILKEIFNG
jgi:3-dehydroquinate dehydratase